MFHLELMYFQGICHFYLSCLIFWQRMFFIILAIILLISVCFILISLFLVLILIICVFSFFFPWSVSLEVCQFCWLFQRTDFWFCSFFCVVYFVCFVSRCWLKVFLSFLPCTLLHRGAHSMAADFIRATKQERNRGHSRWKPEFFCNLILKVASHHFCHIHYKKFTSHSSQ